MNVEKRRATMGALVLCCAVLALLAPARPTLADKPPRPEDLTPDMPPRPEDALRTPGAGNGAGGAILLHVDDALSGAWAVVQWQDGLGNWHDVEGWKGTVEGTSVIWYVDADDFDKGPFRWALYDGAGGDLLVASEDFYLPSSSGQIVHVWVSS